MGVASSGVPPCVLTSSASPSTLTLNAVQKRRHSATCASKTACDGNASTDEYGDHNKTHKKHHHHVKQSALARAMRIIFAAPLISHKTRANTQSIYQRRSTIRTCIKRYVEGITLQMTLKQLAGASSSTAHHFASMLLFVAGRAQCKCDG